MPDSMFGFLEKTFFYPYQVFFAAEKRENQEILRSYAKGIVGDLGCGSANYRDFLLSLADVEDYIGMDYPVWADNFNESAVLAKKMGLLGKALLRASPLQAQIWVDGTNLGIRANAFDTILSLGVLEHVKYAQRYLSEVVRVLKPGGHLIITIPFLYQAHGGDEGADDYYRWTRSGLIHALEQHGLACVEINTFGGVGTMFSQLINGYLIKKLKIYNSASFLWPLLLGASLTPFFFLVNSICWVLDRIDRDTTFSSGFRAVGRKAQA